MPFIDLQESQDRRLQMLLQTANQIQQNKIAREELALKKQQLDPEYQRRQLAQTIGILNPDAAVRLFGQTPGQSAASPQSQQPNSVQDFQSLLRGGGNLTPPLNSRVAFGNTSGTLGVKGMNLKLGGLGSMSLQPGGGLDDVQKKQLDVAGNIEQTRGNEMAKGDMAFGQSDAMVDNLISASKAAYAQAGGGGPIAGRVGNVAAGLGLPNTGNITGLKTTARDSAAAYARVLTGGSRGVLGMFNRILDTMPKDATMNPEQAGSTLAEMYLTGAAIEKGVKSGGLTPEKLRDMSQSDVEKWVAQNQLSDDEQQILYNKLSSKFQTIAPRKQISLSGKVSEPEMNPLNKIYDNIKNGLNKTFLPGLSPDEKSRYREITAQLAKLKSK